MSIVFWEIVPEICLSPEASFENRRSHIAMFAANNADEDEDSKNIISFTVTSVRFKCESESFRHAEKLGNIF